MNIVVTGAGGHLGTVITRDLILEGHNVIPVFRKAPTGNTFTFALAGDLSKEALLDKLKQKPDVIVHTAANIPLADSGAEIITENRETDTHVIRYCRDNNVLLVYTSTAYLYALDGGNAGYLTEMAPVRPSGEYYAGKLASEERIREQLPRHIILRLSSPYGPHKRHENVLIKFIRNVLRGDDLVLSGSGQKLQDFIHEDDASYMARQCIAKSAYGTFNCVYGHSVSMIELAEMLRAMVPGTRSHIRFSDREDPSEKLNIRFSNDRLKALGIAPRVSLQDGLRRLIRHFQEQPHETIS
ncbi:NAD(P)-dependent oxidoreductase [Fulvivirgaceae bacterium PWU4]|uniref:NAD(P)-dependent oxidoreductase n=1 Tax=Chryseosolibacter histidini TaxID=2782349 RepID=A0AAP2GST1_9BACT|nr:NAD(P)-dependent oxidoreductase [Chryseosolibacter histidini]MBT1700912.1 NAD(P)-dependent oxidoreductase [Chryseosolibacter histidini]